MYNFIDKDELLEALVSKYGNLNDPCGCYVYFNGEYIWLSVADIVDVINDCTVYKED